MHKLTLLATILLIIGGINWGLVGLFSIDMISEIAGPLSTLSRLLYTLIGLSALYMIVYLPSLNRNYMEHGEHPFERAHPSK